MEWPLAFNPSGSARSEPKACQNKRQVTNTHRSLYLCEDPTHPSTAPTVSLGISDTLFYSEG